MFTRFIQITALVLFGLCASVHAQPGPVTGGGRLSWLEASNLAYQVALSVGGATNGITAAVATNIANAMIAASNANWVATTDTRGHTNSGRVRVVSDITSETNVTTPKITNPTASGNLRIEINNSATPASIQHSNASFTRGPAYDFRSARGSATAGHISLMMFSRSNILNYAITDWTVGDATNAFLFTRGGVHSIGAMSGHAVWLSESNGAVHVWEPLVAYDAVSVLGAQTNSSSLDVTGPATFWNSTIHMDLDDPSKGWDIYSSLDVLTFQNDVSSIRLLELDPTNALARIPNGGLNVASNVAARAGIFTNSISVNTNGTAGAVNLHGTIYASGMGSNASPVSLLARLSTGQIVETEVGGGAGNPAGDSGAVQFVEGSDFAGTNVFVYDRTNGVLTVGGGSEGSLALTGTGSAAKIKVSPTNSVTVTNLIGLVHVAFASVLALDANQSHDWSVTNRATGVSTLVFTNTSDGQILSAEILGEASGGTSRVITLIPQLGHLISDEDDFSVALATSSSFTLTNGNKAEISWKVRRLNGTNIVGKVVRQSKF